MEWLEIRIVDRDYLIFREVYRWRVCLGRQVRELTGFTGQRACDIRLRKLIEAGYIHRRKFLYGVPSIYSLAHKAKVLISVSTRIDKIKIEQIVHDIAVLDTAIHFHKAKSVSYSDFITEKQLHTLDGFSNRKHRPDIVYNHNSKRICIEVELSLKSKERLEKIIKDNFLEYDVQIWVVPTLKSSIAQSIERVLSIYPNIEIIELSEVKNNA